MRAAGLPHRRRPRDPHPLRDEQQLRVRRHQHVTDLQSPRLMRRVVVTGMGAVSCLGPDRRALFDGLRAGRAGFRDMPGFRAMPGLAALGMRCRVAAPADTDALEPPQRKLRRYLPQAAEYAWHAT